MPLKPTVRPSQMSVRHMLGDVQRTSHVQGETGARRPCAATIDKVCSQARSEQCAEGLNTDGDPTVEVVEGSGSADILVDPAIRLLSELVLRTICADRGCENELEEVHWSDGRMDALKPAMAAPKCPKTGARALLISRLTDSCAFM